MAGGLVKSFCALACAIYSLAAWAGMPNNFVFRDPGYYSDIPITVHYYKAKRADADSQVVIALHGAERNGKRALANWIVTAERHNLIVVAPEFGREHFPSALYHLGGMDRRDPTRWTFPIIENIFEKIRSEEKLNASTYILFGHSAGAQFVHRFMLMMERPRVSVAIAANAGSYMAPTYPASASDFRFPWMLDESLVGGDRLKQVFGRKLIVLLGEQDILIEGPNFPRSREAQAQGATRLERGRNFFAKAKAQAERSGAPFNWQLATVPGVGHDSSGMAKAAAKLLF